MFELDDKVIYEDKGGNTTLCNVCGSMYSDSGVLMYKLEVLNCPMDSMTGFRFVSSREPIRLPRVEELI